MTGLAGSRGATPNPLPDRRLESAAALLLYGAISICYFGLSVLADPSKRFIGHGSDPSIQIWDLAWWPYAIRNGLNPFLARTIWTPEGFNLAWMVGMPGPALAFYPVTRAVGPVISYNLLCLAAPALAAWSAYILCRHITRSFWPSLFGGYVFGFNSYVLGHMLGHIFLVLIFPIPLAVLLVLLKFEGNIRATTFVLFLTLVLAFEFLSSTELFASTAAMGALVGAIAILNLPEDRQARLRLTLLLAALAYGITTILVSPYLYYALVNGEPPPINSATAFSNDLLNFAIPTSMTFLGGDLLEPVSRHFYGNPSESGAYPGLPLLVIIWVLYARSNWNTRIGKLLLISLLVIGLASLGPCLHIAGWATIPLPWAIALLVPLIDQALPARFSAYLFLISSIVGALYLRDVRTRRSLRITLGALSVLSLLPNPWLAFPRSSEGAQPAFFSSGTYRRYLAQDENVIVLPYGHAGNSMLWQAETGMYFRMAGGYVAPRPPAAFQRWDAVMRSLYSGHVYPRFEDELKPFLAANQVDAIVAVKSPKFRVSRRLFASLGVEPLEVDDVLLYRIPRSLLIPYRAVGPERFERPRGMARYRELLQAARAYRSRSLPQKQLSRARAERLGLLPPVIPPVRASDGPLASPPRNWGEDGMLLPWGDDGIAAGMSGVYDIVEPIMQKYQRCSQKIYFPYPSKLSGTPSPDAYGELRMKFDPAGLDCALKLAASP